ncbi:MAG: hypothetical protein WD073_00050 [Xanthobacteraceae bacterium]
MRLRLKILPLLAIANFVLFVAVAGIGREAMGRYTQLVYDFNARNAEKVAEFAVAELAWNKYGQATAKAVELGYAKVYYYALGMDEWNAEHLPLVR